MRHLFGTAAAVAAVVVLLALLGPAQAQAQPGSTASQYDSDWSGVIYPIYGWLPIYRSKTRLPEEPSGGGGTTQPEVETSGDLNSAFLAGFRVDKDRWSLEGGFVYAGLEGEASRPNAKIEVDISIFDLRAGYEVMPDLFVEGGIRQLGLDVTAKIADCSTTSQKVSRENRNV